MPALLASFGLDKLHRAQQCVAKRAVLPTVAATVRCPPLSLLTPQCCCACPCPFTCPCSWPYCCLYCRSFSPAPLFPFPPRASPRRLPLTRLPLVPVSSCTRRCLLPLTSPLPSFLHRVCPISSTASFSCSPVCMCVCVCCMNCVANVGLLICKLKFN